MDPLLQTIIPQLPSNNTELFVYIIAALGAVLLTYSVFVEAENRGDLIRIVGSGSLFVYALYINNILFMISMAGIFLASLVEFIEIYLGLHKHNPKNLKEYKKYAFSAKKRQ